MKSIGKIVQVSISIFQSLPNQIKLVIGIAFVLRTFFLLFAGVFVIFIFVMMHGKKTRETQQHLEPLIQAQAMGKDKFINRSWYEPAFFARKGNWFEREGTFIALRSVDVFKVGEGPSPEAISETKAIKIKKLKPYEIGKYSQKEGERLCWFEQIFFEGPKETIYLSSTYPYEKKILRELRKGKALSYKFVDKPCCYAQCTSSTIWLDKAKKKYFLDKAVIVQKKKCPARRNYQWEQVPILPIRDGDYQWEVKVPLKEWRYAKFCVSLDKVVCGQRRINVFGKELSINKYRIEIAKQLSSSLSEETIHKLLQGKIVLGMTTLMSEAALGPPDKVVKRFETNKQIEIRRYYNGLNGVSLKLVFEGDQLIRWSEY